MQISREELYRRVWQTPVRTLAKEFDISDVGLAKACRKSLIPLPPLGHWVRVQHGKKFTQPPLPKSQITFIKLEANRYRIKRPDIGLGVEKAPAPQLKLPPNVEQLAPFATATLKLLRKTKPDERGLVTCQGPGIFNCYVSPACVDRVARLLHAIEMALPDVDAKPVANQEKDRLSVDHDGQRVFFRIFEQYSRTEHVVKHKEHAWLDRKTYTYNLSGKLTLEIEGYFDGQKRWSDGARFRLDDKLGEAVMGLVAAAKAIKQRELEFELQRQQWAEQARLREERERQRREDEEFRRQLLVEAKTWGDCQAAHAYLARIREELGMPLQELPPESLAWIQSAEAALSEVDPLPRQVRKLRVGRTVQSK